MSEKANYFKIGLFFIISVTLLTVAVIIWGAGLFTKDKIYFETYFANPVTGLAIGSPCELMGVKIGQVEEIDFVSSVYDIPADPEKVNKYERYVRVLFFVSTEESEEQIGSLTNEQRVARVRNLMQRGLRLRLASNILTGQSFIEGVFVDPNRFPVLPIAWEPEHIYVASAPGEFSTIKDSVDQILVKLEETNLKEIVDNVNELLVVIKQTVEDANVPGVTNEMENLFAELREINHLVKQIAEDANVPGVAGEMKSLFAELRGTNQQLKELLTHPDSDAKKVNVAQILVRLDSVLEDINRTLRTEDPEIDKILRNMRAISDNIKALTENLKQHPSEIIFSQPPAKSEIIK
jgi:paraquat-inducible protein B